MAHKARNGWIAPFPDRLAFEVEQQEGRKTIKHSPSGIFVHGSTWAGVYMNYAGLASSGWSTFRLRPTARRCASWPTLSTASPMNLTGSRVDEADFERGRIRE